MFGEYAGLFSSLIQGESEHPGLVGLSVDESFEVMSESELNTALRSFLMKHYDIKLKNIAASQQIPFEKKSFHIRKIRTDIIPRLKKGELVAYDLSLQIKGNKMATASARHILVNDEELCKELKEKINSGEITFEQAAKDNSTCPSGSNGGGLGTFGEGQMVPEFDKVVFNDEVGVVHGPAGTGDRGRRGRTRPRVAAGRHSRIAGHC